MTLDFASSHAIATCAGVARTRSASRASGPPGFARLPVASGNHGMNPRFSRVQ
jgi:hypothetical protein